MLSGVFSCIAGSIIVFMGIWEPYTVAPGSRSPKVSLAMAVSVAHFSRYNPNFTAILSLEVILWDKTNARFETSAYELTTYDPPCVKVIIGHPRSYEVTDLG